MRTTAKRIIVIAMVIIIGILSVIPCFAAEELEINGVKGVKKDDIITYELNLGDCTEEAIGLQMYIIYDREYLSIEDNSFETPELAGSVSNTQGDYITFNWTDVSNPVDFSKKKVMAKVDFKVLKGGKTDITYFVSELYGEDMTYFKNYTFTYDLSVNDEVKIDDETPIVTKDKEAQDKYQGMFVNYVDGKGEENGKTQDNKKRETVLGETQAPSTFETGVNAEESSGEFSLSLTAVIIICAVVILILAIIVVAIISNAQNRKIKEKAIEEQNKKAKENGKAEIDESTVKTTMKKED